ncbi:uncharacterized protein BX664DRAFT_329140 [Halteromyces radiatus]|uniref:uncharacterized protein n=1 Tax=Halteromyces radiatus TaxID=101107 RepID=UPI002220B104|nr:uncharacterized protein BX664DRAFT_329140 [Halteromyces radiatus]KAI8093199.1 hypothetical protein BX664DRAFT_329140 [Halteromyces radiatus]
MGSSFTSTNTNEQVNHPNSTMSLPVCQGRGKNYCLIHRRYFETSWCPDCRSRAPTRPQY